MVKKIVVGMIVALSLGIAALSVSQSAGQYPIDPFRTEFANQYPIDPFSPAPPPQG